jgi:DNA-binding NarL/FixJ family response regulator
MPLEQLRILVAIEYELFSGGLFRLFRDKTGLPLCDIINCSKHLIDVDMQNIPDIALIDLSSPHMNGEGAIRRILKSFPNARLNMLSLYVDATVKRQLKEAGVRGYLENNSQASQFVEYIRLLISGDEYLGNNYKGLIKNKRINFSERELQVLKLIAQGYKDVEIAAILYIKSGTVNGYRKALITKLNVRNTAELVATSIQLGYITF